MSMGGVIRDSWGRWVVGYAKKGPFGDVLLAELWAVFLGLDIADGRNMQSLIIETESLIVYDLLCSSNAAKRCGCQSLTEACRLLMASIPKCTIDHISKKSNFSANFMAKLAMQLDEEWSIFDSSPPCVRPFF